MMMRSRFAAAGLLVATFALGAVLGGVGIGAAEHRRDSDNRASHGRAGFIARLTEQLDLDPSQRDSICSILERHKPLMDSMWQDVRPRFDSARTAIRNEIKAQLTPKQQEQYEALRQRKQQQENRTRRCQ